MRRDGPSERNIEPVAKITIGSVNMGGWTRGSRSARYGEDVEDHYQ